jgi:hypothetical protein
MGGYLVTKFVKQTKINSRFANQPSLNQVALVEAEPEKGKGQVVQGFWGKRMPLCGRNSPDSILRTVISGTREPYLC